MKKLMTAIAVLSFICLCMAMHSNVQLKKKYDVATANVKAYEGRLLGGKTETRALQLTVSQLQYFKDSILVKMDSVRKVLRIKDKNLKSL